MGGIYSVQTVLLRGWYRFCLPVLLLAERALKIWVFLASSDQKEQRLVFYPVWDERTGLWERHEAASQHCVREVCSAASWLKVNSGNIIALPILTTKRYEQHRLPPLSECSHGTFHKLTGVKWRSSNYREFIWKRLWAFSHFSQAFPKPQDPSC